MYHDRKAKSELRPLRPGETVRVKAFGRWVPGVVERLDETPRSYHVRSGNGYVYRRTRTDIIPCHESEYETSSTLNASATGAGCQGQSAEPCPPGQSSSPANHQTNTNLPRSPITNNTNTYRTRYGRVTRKPERFGSQIV